jgi:NTP pyrophosphatase (non-canonical NTP hydrolase)
MDQAYIEALRQTYERYFDTYRGSPVLVIDTNHLNFVTNPTDFQSIAGQIRSVLLDGIIQGRLPQISSSVAEGGAPSAGQSLAEYQKFHSSLDREKGFITDLYFNYLCLSEEMGELGSELAQLWREEAQRLMLGKAQDQAREQALMARRPHLEEELADCMAYLLKIANYAGIDLAEAYVGKMNTNQDRAWR